MELIWYLEKQVEKNTLQSVEEIERLNKIRKIQGSYQKNHIDRLCITSAIKHLSKEMPLQLKSTNNNDNNGVKGR